MVAGVKKRDAGGVFIFAHRHCRFKVAREASRVVGGLLWGLDMSVGSRLDVTVSVRRPEIVVVLQPSEAQQLLRARTHAPSLNFIWSLLDSYSINRKQKSTTREVPLNRARFIL